MDVVLGCAGLEAHEGVWEIVFGEGVLRRKVIGLRLAALPAKGVEIVRMEFKSLSWDHERAGNPAGFEAKNSLACVNCFLTLAAIQLAGVFSGLVGGCGWWGVGGGRWAVDFGWWFLV